MSGMWNKPNIINGVKSRIARREMNRDWTTKALLAFIGSGLWALALMHGSRQVNAQAPTTPDVIKAHKFLLTNDKGAAMAELKINKFGMPSFSMFDAHNVSREEMTLLSEGTPGLFLSDDQSVPKAAIMVFKNGAPGIALYDSQSVIRVGLSTEKDGKPILSLNDDAGNPIYRKP